MYMGVHIIAEFWGVDPEKMSKVKDIRTALKLAISGSNLHPLSYKYHQFKPQGASGVVLLRESHISIHTWPEYGYLVADVFTCGPPASASSAYQILRKHFKPAKTKKEVVRMAY